MLTQNEDEAFVFRRRINMRALINARIHIVRLPRRLLLQVLNLLLHNPLRINQRLPSQIEHDIRIVVFVHLAEDGLTDLIRLFLIRSILLLEFLYYHILLSLVGLTFARINLLYQLLVEEIDSCPGNEFVHGISSIILEKLVLVHWLLQFTLYAPENEYLNSVNKYGAQEIAENIGGDPDDLDYCQAKIKVNLALILELDLLQSVGVALLVDNANIYQRAPNERAHPSHEDD